MDMTALASAFRRHDRPGQDATQAIGAAALGSATTDGTLPLDRPRAIGHIAWLTGPAQESATLSVECIVPHIDPGTYAGVLTFGVVDPGDTAADPRLALTGSGDATITTAVEVTVQ